MEQYEERCETYAGNEYYLDSHSGMQRLRGSQLRIKITEKAGTDMIGIFDTDLNANSFGGKSLRLTNLFQRLKTYHDIIYFPIIPIGTVIPQYLKDLFGGQIQAIYYESIKNALSGRLESLLLQQPGFNYSITNRRFNEQISHQIINICIKNQIKVVHLFDFYIASFFRPLRNSYPIIWDIGDSYWLIHQRKDGWPPFAFNTNRFRNYEFDHVSSFYATVFVGEADLKLYPDSLKDRITLIPNGVGEDFLNYDLQPGLIDPDTIIFSGNMAYPPNVDAVKHFYSYIYPRVKKLVPTLKWFIVGTNPQTVQEIVKADQDIIVTGRVEDIRPYIARSKVYVAPIRLGGGIKNKLLEAMALGKNIVAYNRAVDGFCPGYDIKIAANPDDFVEHVVNGLKAAPELKRSNIEFVKKKYTWSLAVDKYRSLYRNILENSVVDLQQTGCS